MPLPLAAFVAEQPQAAHALEKAFDYRGDVTITFNDTFGSPGGFRS